MGNLPQILYAENSELKNEELQMHQFDFEIKTKKLWEFQNLGKALIRRILETT